MARSGRHNRSCPFSRFGNRALIFAGTRSVELGALNGRVQLQKRKHEEQTRNTVNQRENSMGLSWGVKSSVCGILSLRRFCSDSRLVFIIEICQKGFRWLHASGTTIGSYRNGKESSLLSVRFTRAEATFLNAEAFTCFRWHKANGELESICVLG